MRPSEQLETVRLPNGWTVGKILKRRPTATGGHFSTGYLVENDDGRKGFLKAMDYIDAFQSSNTAQALHDMTEMYLFEKKICEACHNRRMRRVVLAIESGSIQSSAANPLSKVEYLIFELAQGDVRAMLDAKSDFDVAFALRVLHNIATALNQLHTAEMAHQDLKPSNVLVFHSDLGSKISDLGRAWAKALPAPHDDFLIAGDCGYAPPEFLYSDVPTDVKLRRFGCDLYLFGSLIVFLFARVHINALLHKYLLQDHRPQAWGGTFRQALPYLQAAFGEALTELESNVPQYLRLELIEMVRQLCEPDPDRRGHPLNRVGYQNAFSLERYISRFDQLAQKVHLGLLGN